MKPGPAIVAVTPVWNEQEGLLERARLSAAMLDHHVFFEGGIAPLVFGARFRSQVAMRQHGLELAEAWCREQGRELGWLLQVDADEALVNGELLAPILRRWRHRAYPLAYAQESGEVNLAPFKCVRAPFRFEAFCEYVRWPAEPETIYNLAGYMAPAELRWQLLELPFLLHTPSLRPTPIRRAARLSHVELDLEQRPENAVPWPLPPLTLIGGAMPEVDEGGSVREYGADDGDYSCPGCGRRYDTPGICTGHGEAGHEPLAVLHVRELADEDLEAADVAELERDEREHGAAAKGAAAGDDERGPDVDATERAREKAAEAGLELVGVEGTGEDGRITAEDVDRALAARESASASSSP